jgi:hypothetical protein
MRKKILFAIMILSLMTFSIKVQAQEAENKKPVTMEDIKNKVDGMETDVSTLLNDVTGLKKLKITGYMQINFEKTENAAGFGASPYDSTIMIQGRFRVRRSRLKVTYDAGLTQYVLQGDFSNTGFALKDAYVNITDPWTKYFNLTLGQFNRPVYEVEYSSSQRESMERSKVCLTLYPNERDLGGMISFEPEDLFKLQFAAFNNTFLSSVAQTQPNFENEPVYFMTRITKELAIPDLGLGIDIGAHARFGNIVSNTDKVYKSEQNTTDGGKKVYDSTSYKRGDKIGRNWFGVEAQIYWDFLGGTKILGEFFTGTNADQEGTAGKSTIGAPIRLRNFNGYYVMLVKNLPADFQVAVKYDAYDPNTKIDNSIISKAADLSYNDLGFGLHSYYFQNVRLSLWYDIIKNQTIDKNTINGGAFVTSAPQNLFTFRAQYKF